MKLFKKSTISLALTAAMIGGVAMTQQASAALQSAPATGDPYVSVNGTGQALIFPYYTVRGGYQSFFNITNTSGRTVAYKIRFREGLNSRDALDFNLVLSPYDVWAGYIEDSLTGPVVKSQDTSCTVGAPGLAGSGQPLSAIGYNYKVGATVAEQWADQGDQTIDRTREGYLEVLPMGVATSESNSLAVAAKHRTSGPYKGTPFNCDTIDALFKAPAGQLSLPVPFPFTDTTVTTVGGDGDPGAAAHLEAMENDFNPLKGNFSLIDSTKGIGAGNSAVAIADFMDGVQLTTAQNFPYFLEPTLASRDGLWTTTGLADVDAALATQTIANEWANNATSGAETAWTVNFPTKSFYVDDESRVGGTTTTNIQASANRWRTGSNALAAARTGAGFTGSYGDINADGAAVTLSMLNFDREEQYATADPGATQPSPAPVETNTIVSLYRETGVVTFGGTSLEQAQTLPSPAQADLGTANGWTSLAFTTGSFPAVGYVFKLRNQGDVTTAYGQIMDHAYGDTPISLPGN